MATAGSRAALAMVIALASGCGSEEPASGKPEDAGPATCGAGELTLDDGRCLPAGTQESGCLAGEIAEEDGSCRAAGIPPDLCGPGAVANDTSGCDAILPPEACPEGQMAVPGETACRDVAPCATGTWGDIPIEPDTQHVDGAYAGADSDGTAQKPWKTIQSGIDGAPSGAIVAVAAGSYVEDVAIGGKPRRIWGRCPELVEIVATGAALSVVLVTTGASATEVRDIALRGPAIGIAVSGATRVAADRVWIHDTAGPGIIGQEDLGTTGLAVTGSLIETAVEHGIFLSGTDATVEASVVRDTKARSPDKKFGRGIDIQLGAKTGVRSNVAVRGSLIERNRDVGVFVAASDASIEGSVVRDTQPSDAQGTTGWAVGVMNTGASRQRGSAVIRSSILERSRSVGVFVEGSDATIEGTVVRDTLPRAKTGVFGRGLEVGDTPSLGARGSVTVRSSVIERSRDAGILVQASDAIIEGSIVRDTLSEESTLTGGGGLYVQHNVRTGERATAAVTGSVFERNLELGVRVLVSDMVMDGSVVWGTQPNPTSQEGGGGIYVEADPMLGTRASATLRSSVVDGAHEVGILVLGSDAIVEGCIVRGVLASAATGSFGDGVVVLAAPAVALGASASVTGSRIEGSARAGISCFAATASIGDTLLDCNVIHLDGEALGGVAGTFSDLGGNVCGCAGEALVCKVLESSLAPPVPVP